MMEQAETIVQRVVNTVKGWRGHKPVFHPVDEHGRPIVSRENPPGAYTKEGKPETPKEPPGEVVTTEA